MGQDVESIPADRINDGEAMDLILDQGVHSFKYTEEETDRKQMTDRKHDRQETADGSYFLYSCVSGCQPDSDWLLRWIRKLPGVR